MLKRDPLLQQLDAIRTQTAMSSAVVARKSGVSTSTLRNWETGKTRRPLTTTLAAVAKVYGYQLVLTRRS